MYQGNPNLRKAGEKIEYSREMIEEIIKCREDIIYFAEKYFYIISLDRGRETIKLYEWQKKVLKAYQETPGGRRSVIVKIARQSGKKFSLDTLMLTKNGFVQLKDLKVGDKIFGVNGKETEITFMTEISDNGKAYEITFDNGEKVVCCEDHLWQVSNSDNKRNKKNKEIVVDTKKLIEMFNLFNNRKKRGSVFINISKPIYFDYKQVNIDPYLLGLWLGDGTSRCGEITCHKDDFEFYKQELLNRKIEIYDCRICKHSSNSVRFTVKGLKKLLIENNLIMNKHIPYDYIYNSYDVRINLLKGLMDSDGYCDIKGSCEFFQSDIDFVNNFRILLSSLAIKNRIREKETYRKNAYTISFSTDISVFNLNRKKERQLKCKNHLKNKRFYISDIKEVDSVPMRCLQVDSNDHLFLCTKSLIPTHNTTVTTVYLLWYILFHKDKTVGVLAHQQSMAIENLEKIKMAFKNLPIWLQQGIAENGWNKTSLTLENGTRILAAATSPDAFSGFAINILYLDEFAKIPPHIASDFISSVYPVISSSKTSKIIMISTPKGRNLFYEFWMKAIRRDAQANSFFPIRVGWWEVPTRDERWKKQMINDIGKARFDQEFSCKFVGSESTLIDSDIIERMEEKEPVSIKFKGNFKIYEFPIHGVKYVLGVDTGKGTGANYSVIQVLKIIHEKKLEQVAVFRCNNIHPHAFAEICISISDYYYGAPMMIENNSIGQSVCDTIWYEFENENILNVDPKGLGVRSTKKTKLQANMLLKQYLEEGYLILCDKDTINEFENYEEISPDIYAAGKNDTDDCITALLWALFYLLTDFYDDKGSSGGNINKENRIDNEDDEDDDERNGGGFEPIGFMDD